MTLEYLEKVVKQKKIYNMAKVVYINGIDTVRGAVDSVREGQKKRKRLVSRWRDYGERSYTIDGKKWHSLFYYHMHEGAWSDGATRNREMIKAAQRTAHDIERNFEMRKEWEHRYNEYLKKLKPSDKVYRFYNYVFVTIYREMRGIVLSTEY